MQYLKLTLKKIVYLKFKLTRCHVFLFPKASNLIWDTYICLKGQLRTPGYQVFDNLC